MTPTYLTKWHDDMDLSEKWLPQLDVDRLFVEVPWVSVTDARSECFFALEPTEYTYGSGRGVRTYASVPYHSQVSYMQELLNATYGVRYNVCFLNRYDRQDQQLGWHADDSPGMLHEHPIAVVSFGAAREIWWREVGQSGVTPPERRQLLGDGSMFVMPPGFQRAHQHRIPKCDHECGPRVSLTFRRYVPGVA